MTAKPSAMTPAAVREFLAARKIDPTSVRVRDGGRRVRAFLAMRVAGGNILEFWGDGERVRVIGTVSGSEVILCSMDAGDIRGYDADDYADGAAAEPYAPLESRGNASPGTAGAM